MNYGQLKQSTNQIERTEAQTMRSPIEERAMQLEKELEMLNEAVSCLAARIDKVMCPAPEQEGKLSGSVPTAPQSAMTRALDYAINSVAIQRIELVKMAERVEL